MKIQKLTESVFEKLKDATTVINPVTADAVKDNDMREKAVEKILKERGQGKARKLLIWALIIQEILKNHSSFKIL